MPGVSIPAVTTRFEMTKHDMRKGRKTGSPVSAKVSVCYLLQTSRSSSAPGCKVESTIFFACHSSGVMDGIWLNLYAEMSCLACSSPEAETKRVLHHVPSATDSYMRHYKCTYHTILVRQFERSSPGICDFRRLLHTSPVGVEVVSRCGELPTSW